MNKITSGRVFYLTIPEHQLTTIDSSRGAKADKPAPFFSDRFMSGSGLNWGLAVKPCAVLGGYRLLGHLEQLSAMQSFGLWLFCAAWANLVSTITSNSTNSGTKWSRIKRNILRDHFGVIYLPNDSIHEIAAHDVCPLIGAHLLCHRVISIYT